MPDPYPESMVEPSHPLVDVFQTVTKHLIDKGVLDDEGASYAQEAYLSAVREWLYETTAGIRLASRQGFDRQMVGSVVTAAGEAYVERTMRTEESDRNP